MRKADAFISPLQLSLWTLSLLLSLSHTHTPTKVVYLKQLRQKWTQYTLENQVRCFQNRGSSNAGKTDIETPWKEFLIKLFDKIRKRKKQNFLFYCFTQWKTLKCSFVTKLNILSRHLSPISLKVYSNWAKAFLGCAHEKTGNTL